MDVPSFPASFSSKASSLSLWSSFGPRSVGRFVSILVGSFSSLNQHRQQASERRARPSKSVVALSLTRFVRSLPRIPQLVVGRSFVRSVGRPSVFPTSLDSFSLILVRSFFRWLSFGLGLWHTTQNERANELQRRRRRRPVDNQAKERTRTGYIPSCFFVVVFASLIAHLSFKSERKNEASEEAKEACRKKERRTERSKSAGESDRERSDRPTDGRLLSFFPHLTLAKKRTILLRIERTSSYDVTERTRRGNEKERKNVLSFLLEQNREGDEASFERRRSFASTAKYTID